jgi:hypothetical protein
MASTHNLDVALLERATRGRAPTCPTRSRRPGRRPGRRDSITSGAAVFAPCGGARARRGPARPAGDTGAPWTTSHHHQRSPARTSSPGAKWISLPWRVRPDSIAVVAPRRTLDQHLLAPSDAGLVTAQRRAVEHLLEAFEAVLDHVVGRRTGRSWRRRACQARGEKMKV